MSDYIKREDAVKAVANAYWHGTDCECYAFAHKALDNVPTADVAPVRHGRWIDKGDGAECSICGSFWKYDGLWDRNGFIRVFRYCETCGARMDGDGNEID